MESPPQDVAAASRSRPALILWPLLLFAVLFGIGIFGVTYGAAREARHAQEHARSLALGAALRYRTQLAASFAPVRALAALVSRAPQYNTTSALFSLLAPALVDLLLAPSGVVQLVEPLPGHEHRLGLDVFASPDPVIAAAARRSAATPGLSISGPLPIVAGDSATDTSFGSNAGLLVVRMAVRVNASGPEETFGRPSLPDPACGSACAYNATTGTAFWGFSTAWPRPWAHWRHAFTLTAPPPDGGEGPWVLVASSGVGPGGGLRDPVEAAVELQGLKWRLRVAPHGASWTPAWYGGAVAAVVVASAAAAVLLFALLMSRYQKTELLRMLLPRELLDEISPQQAKELGSRAVDADDTPADVLLELLAALLAGEPPDVQDIVLIRTVLQQGRDVYRPLNLEGRLHDANLETDVADALMRQLGANSTSAHWPAASPAAGPAGTPVTGAGAPSGSRALAPASSTRGPAMLKGTGTGTGFGNGFGNGTGSAFGMQLQTYTRRPSMNLFESPMHEALGYLLSNAADPGVGPSPAPTAAAGARAQGSAQRLESTGQLSMAEFTAAFFTDPGPMDDPQQPQSAGGKGTAAGVNPTATATATAVLTAAAATAAGAGNPLPAVPAPLSHARSGGLLLRLGLNSAGTGPTLLSSAASRRSGETPTVVTAAPTGAVEGGEASPAGLSRRLSVFRIGDPSNASFRGVVGSGGGSTGPPPKALLDKVESLLAHATTPGCWQFDSFALAAASGGHALSTLGTQLTEHYLDPLGLLAAYLAAIVHDLGHPGLTGDFLVATSAPLALRYNDRSPLEAHHASAAFSLMAERPDLDALAPLGREQRAALRKLVIDLVLGTDMKQHFAMLAQFKTVRKGSRRGRKLVIDLVLGTDMKQHFAMLAQFKTVRKGSRRGSEGQHTIALQPQPPPQQQPMYDSSRSDRGNRHRSCANALAGATAATAVGHSSGHANTGSGPQAPPTPLDDADRLLSLQLALKVADIGHLGSELGVHKRWLAALEEEFFRQGDRERELGLPISPLFDRTKTGVSKSQVGFMDFVALPLVRALADAFPGARGMQVCFEANYQHWKEQADLTATPPRRAAA
ncbi:hypothetical protein HYH03_004373 [Edaphochlamys debaryana]|uniref:Phosphodiesterase n=1 Tax=Edaphochlamys debaryana TaxID=47281 RepID=A0A836C3F9_9CHLO|nr:hypothetical protein HYH03_004373 [Edaphochlamys debaryana]|eukprot:KAG2497634.1 hypothetical protein HYH03_004373 [Edaphochlamys debaryana]